MRERMRLKFDLRDERVHDVFKAAGARTIDEMVWFIYDRVLEVAPAADPAVSVEYQPYDDLYVLDITGDFPDAQPLMLPLPVIGD